MREIPPFEDGDYSEEKFKERYNADLANGLGNFSARVIGLAEKFREIKNDFSLTELSIEQRIKTAQKKIAESLGGFKFNEALAEIWSLISFGDRYVNENKPWEGEEKGNTRPKNEKVLYNLLVLLNAVGVFLEPFLPETSKKITGSISLKGKIAGVKKIEALFPRKE